MIDYKNAKSKLEKLVVKNTELVNKEIELTEELNLRISTRIYEVEKALEEHLNSILIK